MDKEKDIPPKTVQETELALSKLRDNAINGLLKEGREASFTSSATPTKDGLSVTSSNDKTHEKDQFQITGAASESYRPSFSSAYPVGLGVSESNDFKIVDGSKVENDHVKFASGLYLDGSFDPNQGTVDISKIDASGKQLQTAHADYDRTGHNNGKTGAVWQIQDSKYGNVNINEDVTGQPGTPTEYRGVIRDKENHILGIVDQTYTIDQDGNLKTVSTQARKSQFQGQVVPPKD
jgi:hypothetical protein